MPINFTVTDDLFASTDDTDDVGIDADVVPLIGTVKFTPQFRDDRAILAPSASPRPVGFKIRSFTGFMDDDGQLKSRPGGTVGVRLWANDPLFGINELWYRVDYDLATPIGETVKVAGGYLKAPTTDTPKSLVSELQQTGSAGVGVTRGVAGPGVDDVSLNGDGDVVFWAEGDPIGDPLDLDVLVFDMTTIDGGTADAEGLETIDGGGPEVSGSTVDLKRMQQRRGLATAWTSGDPILSPGEIGVSFNVDGSVAAMKLGDGIRHWSALPNLAAVWGAITGQPAVVAAGATAADARAAIGIDLADLDEVDWYANLAAFPGTGVTDAVYGARDTGILYRWNGSAYSQVGGGALSANLAALSALTSTANKGIQFTGSGTAATYDLTAAGKALLDDADSAAQRITLGAQASLITTAVQTTGYTAAVNDLIPADATSGGFTITLPNAPADKSIVLVKKIDSTTNPVTIARGGSTDVFNVASGATSLQIVLQDQTVALQYKASSGIWYVTSHGMPLAGLDARYAGNALTNPEITGALLDSNGNVILSFNPITGAVNYLEVENSTGGTGPTVYARGSGANLNIWWAPKGIGRLLVYDTNNDGVAGIGADGPSGNTTLALAGQGTGGVTADNVFQGFATTPTAAGTTTLTVTSKRIQEFTGSTTQTVKLPTTALPAGAQYLIINQSSGAVTVQSSGANTIATLAAGTSAVFTARVATPTTAANWYYEAAATVTSVTTAATVTVRDDRFTMQDDADATKQLTRDLANIPTGVTRKMVMPVSRTSQLSVANTTTETDIISMTLPTGVLVAGTTFRIRIAGTVQNQATSGTLTLTPYLGANFAQQFFVMPTQGSAAGPNKFWTEWDITVRTTGVSGTFVAGGGGLLPVGPWYPIGSAAAGTSVIDTTGTPVVKMTAQWQTASATNILLVETATIEQIV